MLREDIPTPALHLFPIHQHQNTNLGPVIPWLGTLQSFPLLSDHILALQRHEHWGDLAPTDPLSPSSWLA